MRQNHEKYSKDFTSRFYAEMGLSFGMLAALGDCSPSAPHPWQDYKALVCIFMSGGNDRPQHGRAGL